MKQKAELHGEVSVGKQDTNGNRASQLTGGVIAQQLSNRNRFNGVGEVRQNLDTEL